MGSLIENETIIKEKWDIKASASFDIKQNERKIFFPKEKYSIIAHWWLQKNRKRYGKKKKSNKKIKLYRMTVKAKGRAVLSLKSFPYPHP